MRNVFIMDLNVQIVLSIYFAIITQLTRYQTVLGHSDASENCVGHSCKGTSSAGKEHYVHSEEERNQHRHDSFEFEGRSIGLTSSTTASKSVANELGIENENQDGDVEEVLHNRREVQQQKAIEETHKKFLSRRPKLPDKNDDEVEDNKEQFAKNGDQHPESFASRQQHGNSFLAEMIQKGSGFDQNKEDFSQNRDAGKHAEDESPTSLGRTAGDFVNTAEIPVLPHEEILPGKSSHERKLVTATDLPNTSENSPALSGNGRSSVPPVSERTSVPPVSERMSVPPVSERMSVPQESEKTSMLPGFERQSMPPDSKQLAEPSAFQRSRMPPASEKLSIPSGSERLASASAFQVATGPSDSQIPSKLPDPEKPSLSSASSRQETAERFPLPSVPARSPLPESSKTLNMQDSSGKTSSLPGSEWSHAVTSADGLPTLHASERSSVPPDSEKATTPPAIPASQKPSFSKSTIIPPKSEGSTMPSTYQMPIEQQNAKNLPPPAERSSAFEKSSVPQISERHLAQSAPVRSPRSISSEKSSVPPVSATPSLSPLPIQRAPSSEKSQSLSSSQRHPSTPHSERAPVPSASVRPPMSESTEKTSMPSTYDRSKTQHASVKAPTARDFDKLPVLSDSERSSVSPPLERPSISSNSERLPVQPASESTTQSQFSEKLYNSENSPRNVVPLSGSASVTSDDDKLPRKDAGQFHGDRMATLHDSDLGKNNLEKQFHHQDKYFQENQNNKGKMKDGGISGLEYQERYKHNEENHHFKNMQGMNIVNQNEKEKEDMERKEHYDEGLNTREITRKQFEENRNVNRRAEHRVTENKKNFGFKNYDKKNSVDAFEVEELVHDVEDKRYNEDTNDEEGYEVGVNTTEEHKYDETFAEDRNNDQRIENSELSDNDKDLMEGSIDGDETQGNESDTVEDIKDGGKMPRQIMEQDLQTDEEIKFQYVDDEDFFSGAEELESDETQTADPELDEQFLNETESEGIISRESELDGSRVPDESLGEESDGTDEVSSISSDITRKSSSLQEIIQDNDATNSELGFMDSIYQPPSDLSKMPSYDNSDAFDSNNDQSSFEAASSFADNSSWVDYISTLCDWWSGKVLNMLPSSLQVFGPSKAFTLLLVSSFTFFIISLIFYCRKSCKSGSKSNVKEVSDVQRKLITLQQERDDFQKQANNTKAQLMDIQIRYQKANIEVKESLSQLNRIMAEKDDFKQNAVLLSNQIRQLTGVIETQNQSIQMEQEQNLSYQQTNHHLSSHVSYLEAQLYGLTNQWSLAKKGTEEMELQVQCMSEELSVLQTSKDKLQLELEEWKEKVQTLMQQKNQIHKELKCYKEKILQKEKEIQFMQDFFPQLKMTETAASPAQTFEHADAEGGDPERQNKENDNKGLGIIVPKSLQDMLTNVVEISEIHKKMNELEAERDSLKCLVSAELENRTKLEDEINQLKETVLEERRNREAAEKKAREAGVRTEVLSNYFQEKESELNRKLSSLDRKKSSEDASILQVNVADDRTRDLEPAIRHYREKADTLDKEIQRMDAEYKKQLATQEKKTHENWLLARQSEREAKDFKNEASMLKLKVLELQSRLDDLVADKSQSDSLQCSSSMMPDITLVRPHLPPPPPLLPPPIPPSFKDLFSAERPPIYGPPPLPFPPHLFDIPLPPDHPYHYPRIHRRSLPFNVRKAAKLERFSSVISYDKPSHESHSPYSESSMSSVSLKLSPVMPTGKDSPPQRIQSPPKFIDRPGPEGTRPLPVRPHNCIE